MQLGCVNVTQMGIVPVRVTSWDVGVINVLKVLLGYTWKTKRVVRNVSVSGGLRPAQRQDTPGVRSG